MTLTLDQLSEPVRRFMFDLAVAEIAKMPPFPHTLETNIVEGMLVRRYELPQGSIIAIPPCRRPFSFTVERGGVQMAIENTPQAVYAPFVGIVDQGEGLIIKSLEPLSLWTSVHVTSKTTAEEANAEVFQPRKLPLIDER